jgi:hypothetical protein
MKPTGAGKPKLVEIDVQVLEQAAGGLAPLGYVAGAALLGMAGVGIWGANRQKQQCRARGGTPEVQSAGGGVFVRCREKQ